MNDHILTPEFSRLHDWCGIWAIEPMHARLLFDAVQRVDLRAHMQAEPPKLQSAIEKVPARDGRNVAVIRIAGSMMKSQSSMGGTSTVQLRRDIRAAAADSEVSGILLTIDSPGGTVAGTDDLAADVRAARAQKPVVAQIEDLGASAAYWIASQAEAIYANSQTAMVGSIGTFVTIYDSSMAASNAGIRAFHFATGPLKGAGTPGTPLTDEQRGHFQALIDQSQKTFDAAVQRGRNMSDKQLADVRSGGVFMGDVAISKKLIDGIQSTDKTIEQMKRGVGGSRRPLAGALPMAAKATLPMLESKLPACREQ